MRKKLLLILAILLLVIAGIHISAIAFSLYWHYWWFDIPMHFLGGMAVGIFSVILLILVKERRSITWPPYIVAFISILIVGILWEIFEYQTGLTYNAIGNYLLDTGKDLIVDIAGAFFAVYAFSRTHHGEDR